MTNRTYNTPTEARTNAIKAWICDPANSGNCAECPYNDGQSAWPGHRLPCGQFTCWVDLHTTEEETEDDDPEENVEPLRLQFEATPDGNALSGKNDSLFIRCIIEAPEGASDDYGYLTMKEAILSKLTDSEKETVSFWYDGQEQHLADDASADADVDLYIERL